MDDFREWWRVRRAETGRPGGEHFGLHFWEFRQTRGNGPSDQNGLARESLNLRSMDYGGSVDMAVFR